MKKLGLLIIGAFLFVACESTSSGNKGILPLDPNAETDAAEPDQAAQDEETATLEDVKDQARQEGAIVKDDEAEEVDVEGLEDTDADSTETEPADTVTTEE